MRFNLRLILFVLIPYAAIMGLIWSGVYGSEYENLPIHRKHAYSERRVLVSVAFTVLWALGTLSYASMRTWLRESRKSRNRAA